MAAMTTGLPAGISNQFINPKGKLETYTRIPRISVTGVLMAFRGPVVENDLGIGCRSRGARDVLIERPANRLDCADTDEEFHCSMGCIGLACLAKVREVEEQECLSLSYSTIVRNITTGRV